MQISAKISKAAKKHLVKGFKIRFKKPKICPVCGRPSKICLQRWGWYSVNAKRFLKINIESNKRLYFPRFFCKKSCISLSFIPEIFIPRKCFAKEFINYVAHKLIKKKLKQFQIAKSLGIHYQTIQKWKKINLLQIQFNSIR